jgi:GNAT superfamily N-acetyltransferase
VDPREAVAAELIDAMAAEMAAVYAEIFPMDGRSNYRPELFDPSQDLFLVGEFLGKPLACGGLRWFDEDIVEVKRMYVAPSARGQGVGRALLTRLEAEARRLGYSEVVLETGVAQPHAIALYEGAGYIPADPWPPYDTRDYARCFRKPI